MEYQGTVKINLDQIVPHPSISSGFDRKNVERLLEIFNKDGCRRLDVRNHVTAIVSRHHLNVALHSAWLRPQSLISNPPDQHPYLHFPTGNVQCLHGQHRLKAAEELLAPSDQWWTVDLYLDGKNSFVIFLMFI